MNSRKSKPMKLPIPGSVVFAMLMVSCASYTSIAPTALMDHSPERLQLIVPGDLIRLTMKHGGTMRNLKVASLDSGKIKVLQDRLGSGGQWQHFTQTIMITDIGAIQKSIEPTMADGGVLLVAENVAMHRYHYFRPGQVVLYKIKSSRGFKKGRISGFTDSTISFQDRKGANAILLHAALAAIVIPSSPGRTAGGAALMTLGIGTLAVDGVFVIFTTTFGGDQIYEGEEVGAGVLGLAALAGGITLVKDKKIDLEKTWRLTTIKLPTN